MISNLVVNGLMSIRLSYEQLSPEIRRVLLGARGVVNELSGGDSEARMLMWRLIFNSDQRCRLVGSGERHVELFLRKKLSSIVGELPVKPGVDYWEGEEVRAKLEAGLAQIPKARR